MGVCIEEPKPRKYVGPLYAGSPAIVRFILDLEQRLRLTSNKYVHVITYLFLLGV